MQHRSGIILCLKLSGPYSTRCYKHTSCGQSLFTLKTCVTKSIFVYSKGKKYIYFRLVKNHMWQDRMKKLIILFLI